MDNQLLNKANDHVHRFMTSAVDAAKRMQDAPIGMEKRSQREIGTMIKKIQELPQSERNSRMQELADYLGHKGDKPDNCELCTYLAGKVNKVK